MRHAYGLDEAAEKYRDQAATLASGVLALHAADVDANAAFPEESVAALAARASSASASRARSAGRARGRAPSPPSSRSWRTAAPRRR